jgi:prephenate dehydratase
MTAIHSISLGGWEYGFYAEVDGHAASTNVHAALEELTGKTVEWWMLGSFPK